MSLCCPSYSLRLSRSTMLTCSSCVIATLLILVPVYIRHKARLYECHSSPSKCVKQVALEHFLSYHLNVMPTTHPRTVQRPSYATRSRPLPPVAVHPNSLLPPVRFPMARDGNAKDMQKRRKKRRKENDRSQNIIGI